MTTPGAAPFNSASGNAHVGVQAQNIDGDIYPTIVHGDLHQRFELPPGATPEEKYHLGRKYLISGAATRARELIWDAMMHDCQGSEVLFHWLVAMLSGRTMREFSDEEVSQLEIARKRHPAVGSDTWTDGVRVIFRLFEAVGLLPETPKPDISAVVKEFDALGAGQHEMLLPHLELFLDGPLKDGMWRCERRSAQARRLGGDRKNRAWMFFQPIPAGPRVRHPGPLCITPADRLAAWTATGIFTAAAAYIGWELLWHGLLLGVLAFVACLAGGAVAVVNGRELRFLAERRRIKDGQLQRPRPSASRLPRGGFAGKVDALFRRYSAKYVPDQEERRAWQAATAGIRAFDRDEIVEVYRESRIPAERVAWLIRYRIRQSRDRWRNGTLYDYRNQLRPGPGTVTAFRTGAAIAILGGIGAIAILRVHPLAAMVGVPAGLLSGFCAWRRWREIDLERRQYAADTDEAERRRADTEAEFTRWTRVLERRPTDAEVAAWLDCDRTMLLGEAMDHYKLARSQLLTYAFLEVPGTGARRARVRNGPMRYSRYQLVVFLLTSDGVRQMTADLSFLAGTLQPLVWISYRYDAVASVHVSLVSRAPETRRIQQTFELTLINGNPISVIVTDLDPADFEQGEEADSLRQVTLDAASMTNTMHVLEGIAAEGKAWFQGRKAGQGREGTRDSPDGRSAAHRLRRPACSGLRTTCSRAR